MVMTIFFGHELRIISFVLSFSVSVYSVEVFICSSVFYLFVCVCVVYVESVGIKRAWLHPNYTSPPSLHCGPYICKIVALTPLHCGSYTSSLWPLHMQNDLVTRLSLHAS